MPRIRTIKPEFFFNEELVELEEEYGLPIRLAYIGLWTQCDREGRFEWKPKRLKAQLFPYEDIDFSRVLHALTTREFLKKYGENGGIFGFIPGFLEHQVVNNREKASEIPEFNKNNDLTREDSEIDACMTREPRVPQGREGKGREGNKGKSSGNPSHGESPVTSLPTKTKDEFLIYQDDVDAWSKTYPRLDVMEELRSMYGWLDSNPKKGKTLSGMRRFINSWLQRATKDLPSLRVVNDDYEWIPQVKDTSKEIDW